MTAAPPLPQSAPSRFMAGTTQKWTTALPEYLASAGWVLTYYLRGPSVLNITTVANQDSHDATISAASSAMLQAGNYTLSGWVSKAGEKFEVERGPVIIDADISAATAGEIDGRSQTKKLLDAVELLLAGKTVKDVFQYSIGGRALTRYSMEELFDLRDRLARQYADEQNAGKPGANKVRVIL